MTEIGGIDDRCDVIASIPCSKIRRPSRLRFYRRLKPTSSCSQLWATVCVWGEEEMSLKILFLSWRWPMKTINLTLRRRERAVVIVIVISEFLERHSRGTRAPAYSRALRPIKGVVQRVIHSKW